MRPEDFIGKTITDFFCNGFFGREYDLAGSKIVSAGYCWIVIQKRNGLFEFTSWQYYDHVRDEKGLPTGEIQNLRIRTDMVDDLKKWTAED